MPKPKTHKRIDITLPIPQVYYLKRRSGKTSRYIARLISKDMERKLKHNFSEVKP